MPGNMPVDFELVAKKYSLKAGKALAPVCELLGKEITKAMPKGSGRMYYNMPAWLIKENPIVAYRSARQHVLLLFWSGQSFKTSGLTGSGKFKAAMTRYRSIEDIDLKQLRAWLKESKKIQWNYRDIRKNKGKLEML